MCAHEILDGVKFRRMLSVTALIALGLAGLTACQSKFGLAASVDGARLSDSGLSGYVQPGAKPYTDSSTGASVTPKLFALQNWIDTRIIESAVEKHGAPTSDQELSQARTVVLGSHTVAEFEKYYDGLGYTNAFAKLILDQSATFVVLAERVAHVSAAKALGVLSSNGQPRANVLAAIKNAHAKVEVSPRYGEWDATNLALSSDAGSGSPNFVRFPGKNNQNTEPTTTP